MLKQRSCTLTLIIQLRRRCLSRLQCIFKERYWSQIIYSFRVNEDIYNRLVILVLSGHRIRVARSFITEGGFTIPIVVSTFLRTFYKLLKLTIHLFAIHSVEALDHNIRNDFMLLCNTGGYRQRIVQVFHVQC